jgi:hypothetical protein
MDIWCDQMKAKISKKEAVKNFPYGKRMCTPSCSYDLRRTWLSKKRGIPQEMEQYKQFNEI